MSETQGAPATPQAPPTAPAAAPSPAPAVQSAITQPPAPTAPPAPPAAPSAPAEVVIKAPDKIPPGYGADKMIAALKAIPGITSEVAQKFLEADLAAYQGHLAEQEKTLAAWSDQVKADPEIGGVKFDAAMKHAADGAEFLGGKALQDLLGPLAKHPVILKAFAKAGRSLAEDSSRGAPGGQTAQPSYQQALQAAYPTMFNADGTPK